MACAFSANSFNFANKKNMVTTFTNRLSDDNEYKREELIRKIEHAVEGMTLKELEALSYDMFTKGYLESC